MSVVSRTGSAGGQAAVARVPAGRRLFRRLDAKVSPYLYISPFFVIFGVFGLFPLGYTAYVSLTDRNLLNPVSHFIGLHNYASLIHDSYFWNAVENTFGIWFLSTVPQLLLALAIAHVLNTRLRARTFFRMAVLLPQVTSLVAVALIFTQLFGHDYGFVNYVLGQFGIHHVYWEAGRFSSWVALSVMVTWRWTGYNALIYLAAMQSIPEELYEAAAVDGARRFRQFVHVTVPMLRPTILFTVIISTIGGLQLFTEPYLFQPRVSGGTGGSARQYQTIVMYLYEKFLGSTQFKFGYAAAIAWCLVLLIALFGLLNYFLVSRIRSAEA
ncbi:MAG TPA: sugar ABC transporter permease [Gaiellaceae bacterium]|nr:sugar ABC transporter permease [Gaiellaceae bacterium]